MGSRNLNKKDTAVIQSFINNNFQKTKQSNNAKRFTSGITFRSK
jgi:hypothetical protein